jgi:hypothetical protein
LDPDASQLAQLLWCQATAAGTGSKLLKPGEAAKAAAETCFGESKALWTRSKIDGNHCTGEI